MHQKVDNVIKIVLYFIEFAEGRTIPVNKYYEIVTEVILTVSPLFVAFRIKRIFKQHAQFIYICYTFLAEALRKR